MIFKNIWFWSPRSLAMKDSEQESLPMVKIPLYGSKKISTNNTMDSDNVDVRNLEKDETDDLIESWQSHGKSKNNVVILKK